MVQAPLLWEPTRVDLVDLESKPNFVSKETQ